MKYDIPAHINGEPIAIVTRSYVRIHPGVQDLPFWDDPRAVAVWMRSLAEQGAAKRRRTRGYVRPSVWGSILEAFGHRCAYCGASAVPLEKDHRVAVSRGGPDDPANLVPACKPCNVRKSNDDPETWPLLIEPVW